MKDGLKYKRNWMFEQMADVFFINGTEDRCLCVTNNKGRIDKLEIDGKFISPEQFGEYGISSVHFMTPASLEVEIPTQVLVATYLELGQSICEGDTMAKCNRRAMIADEIYKRGENIHDLMSEVKE